VANDFEKDFEEKFTIIRKCTGAFLFRLYPPTRCVGMNGKMPSFVQCGRALFDVAGWMGERTSINGRACFIGIEQKATKQRHPSMAIIGADANGSGLQAHQLESLAALHRDGGIARVMWCNGGVVGVLDGDEIARTFFDYGVSLAAQKLGKKPAKGSRSIPWALFRTINLDEEPWAVILPPAKKPTLAQEIAAKNRQALKQIEESMKQLEANDANDAGDGYDPF